MQRLPALDPTAHKVSGPPSYEAEGGHGCKEVIIFFICYK